MTIIIALFCTAMITVYVMGMLMEHAPCADYPVSSLAKEDEWVDDQVALMYVPLAPPAHAPAPAYGLDSLVCLEEDHIIMEVSEGVAYLQAPTPATPEEGAHTVCATPKAISFPVVDWEAELSLVMGITLPEIRGMELDTPCVQEIEDPAPLDFTLESGLPC